MTSSTLWPRKQASSAATLGPHRFRLRLLASAPSWQTRELRCSLLIRQSASHQLLASSGGGVSGFGVDCGCGSCCSRASPIDCCRCRCCWQRDRLRRRNDCASSNSWRHLMHARANLRAPLQRWRRRRRRHRKRLTGASAIQRQEERLERRNCLTASPRQNCNERKPPAASYDVFGRHGGTNFYFR